MNEIQEDPERLVARSGATEDQWVDQLMPEDYDWVSLVQEHPLLSLSIAAVGGFLLGRWQGQEILDAASDLAAAKVSSTVNRAIGS